MGNASGRTWRRAAGLWAGAVVVGGGLTLWLQEAGEPPPPAVWERVEPSPAPGLPDDGGTRCPVPEPLPTPEDGLIAYGCLVTTP